jgi:hypothetical protein
VHSRQFLVLKRLMAVPAERNRRGVHYLGRHYLVTAMAVHAVWQVAIHSCLYSLQVAGVVQLGRHVAALTVLRNIGAVLFEILRRRWLVWVLIALAVTVAVSTGKLLCGMLAMNGSV